jgi:hypothetical protein
LIPGRGSPSRSPHTYQKADVGASMPKGPRGEKRPADVIGNAVHVMRIAIGEIEDTAHDPAMAHARKGGQKGGRARAARLTDEQRSEIARVAAQARWKKPRS